MSDFSRMEPGTIPGFAEVGNGTFMTIEALPDRTVRNMAAFVQRLRSMHDDDALAFEVCVRHVGAAVEDQRRSECKADPRDLLTPATDECKILHQQKLPPDWGHPTI